ncbi:MAG TPA: response regulator [Vicinamibacterales bacterium]|nr:response regulator [Vicinamibacterales bacterium]
MKTNRYVLIVDDFTDGREMVEEYLAFRGLEVKTASDGAGALQLAARRPPAVVLMDLTMPGVDGWEATRRLKADPRMRDTIVIAFTANALVHDKAKALGAGADAFIVKPYDLAALGDMVIAVLHGGRAALDGSIAGLSGSRV